MSVRKWLSARDPITLGLGVVSLILIGICAYGLLGLPGVTGEATFAGNLMGWGIVMLGVGLGGICFTMPRDGRITWPSVVLMIIAVTSFIPMFMAFAFLPPT